MPYLSNEKKNIAKIPTDLNSRSLHRRNHENQREKIVSGVGGVNKYCIYLNMKQIENILLYIQKI